MRTVVRWTSALRLAVDGQAHSPNRQASEHAASPRPVSMSLMAPYCLPCSGPYGP